MTLLTIGDKNIGGENLFFVIEEGLANLGNFDKALAMIDAAALTGADAIEFQIVKASDFIVKHDSSFRFISQCEFSNSQINDLIVYTKKTRLKFIAVPLSHRLIEPLAMMGCSGLNINASDLTNPDIIDAAVDSGLPFYLGIPLATEKEIDWAINRIRSRGNRVFALLHGQHTMMSGGCGIDVIHTALGYIATIKEKYRMPVGFIDHTSFVWMPAAAVAAGADFVCKHLAISRNDKGPDWQVCLEPAEMKQAVIWAKEMRVSLGTSSKILAPGEDKDRYKMRRSIVAAKTITAGKVIEREDIVFKRPGTGIDPSRYEEILGKVVIREIKADEQIENHDLRG